MIYSISKKKDCLIACPGTMASVSKSFLPSFHLWLLICCSFVSVGASSNTDSRLNVLLFQKKSESLELPSCLSDGKAKPKVKFRFGALDNKAVNKTPPAYPEQAKQGKIAGTVKVDIVVDVSTGDIEWAKITSGHKLLQEAVGKVICQVKFPPTLDIDHRTKASGTLTYKFMVPRD